MYRVLIADDEGVERRGIRFLLQGLNRELEITDAVNGKEALEWLQTHETDILLTDVRMPFMDGMELIRRVREFRPDLAIVIFSGFSEFEYARTAMRYRVSNYILKPVDPEEFSQTMNSVFDRVDEFREEQRIRQKQKQEVLEHLMFSLINGADPEAELEKHGTVVPRDLVEQYHSLLLLETSSDVFARDEGEVNAAIADALSMPFLYLNLDARRAVLFFLDSEEDWKRIADCLLELLDKAERRVKGFASAAEGISGAKDLSRAFDEAEIRMEQKFFAMESTLFLPEEESADAGENGGDGDLLEQMKKDIKAGDTGSLRVHYHSFKEKIGRRRNYSQIYVKFLFSSLIKDLSDASKKMKDVTGLVEALYSSRRLAEIFSISDAAVEEFCGVRSEKNQGHKEIDTVRQYICSNFGRDLSIEQLAEMVYMAPSYLSALFKRETGQNLSKFIRTVRMTEAEKLLSGTYMKIGEIGVQVGYPNVSYFCQSFRDYYGITPQKFRQNRESGADE